MNVKGVTRGQDLCLPAKGRDKPILKTFIIQLLSDCTRTYKTLLLHGWIFKRKNVKKKKNFKGTPY